MELSLSAQHINTKFISQNIGLAEKTIHSINPQVSIEKALNDLFPEKSEENKITRTRRILGETATTLSNEQIEFINTQFQFLVDTWLDEFEREVFGDKTLKEVLNGG